MSDNKKYYYLKLKDSFFESDSIIMLESMKDGYIYSNILLKLYLRSLKNEGKLMFNNRIPYNETILAQVTRHSVGDVEKALKLFRELDLIEVLDNGAIYMLDIQNFIGESSTEADRIREYRKRIEQEKRKDVTNVITNDTTNVITNVQQTNNKSTPEIEIDREYSRDRVELEREYIVEQSPTEYVFPSWLSDKDIESVKKGNPKNYDSKIPIVYLNQKTNSKFKFVEASTRLINARLKEGFTVDDFKKVIDVKTTQWKNDPNMSKYLRPTTLFGTKFESYLNEHNTNELPLYHYENVEGGEPIDSESELPF